MKLATSRLSLLLYLIVALSLVDGLPAHIDDYDARAVTKIRTTTTKQTNARPTVNTRATTQRTAIQKITTQRTTTQKQTTQRSTTQRSTSSPGSSISPFAISKPQASSVRSAIGPSRMVSISQSISASMTASLSVAHGSGSLVSSSGVSSTPTIAISSASGDISSVLVSSTLSSAIKSDVSSATSNPGSSSVSSPSPSSASALPAIPSSSSGAPSVSSLHMASSTSSMLSSAPIISSASASISSGGGLSFTSTSVAGTPEPTSAPPADDGSDDEEAIDGCPYDPDDPDVATSDNSTEVVERGIKNHPSPWEQITLYRGTSVAKAKAMKKAFELKKEPGELNPEQGTYFTDRQAAAAQFARHMYGGLETEIAVVEVEWSPEGMKIAQINDETQEQKDEYVKWAMNNIKGNKNQPDPIKDTFDMISGPMLDTSWAGVTPNMWQYAILTENGLKGMKYKGMKKFKCKDVKQGTLPYLRGFEDEPGQADKAAGRTRRSFEVGI